MRDTNATLRERPRDGRLMQTFVRLAATCPSASKEERQMAADYGQTLYKELPDESNIEALAMAMMGIGKQQDAIDYQAQAMFEAVKRNDAASIARLRALLDRFKAGQAATQPWAADHPFLLPPRLQPSTRPAAG
jgi:hypothetical protein